MLNTSSVYGSRALLATVFNTVDTYILFMSFSTYLLLVLLTYTHLFMLFLSYSSVRPLLKVPPYSLLLVLTILVVHVIRFSVWGDELLGSRFLSFWEIIRPLIELSFPRISLIDFISQLSIQIAALIYGLLYYQLSSHFVYYFYYCLFINVILFIYFIWLLLLKTNSTNYIFLFGIVSHRYFYLGVNLSYSIFTVLVAADSSSATGSLPANLFLHNWPTINSLIGERGYPAYFIPAGLLDHASHYPSLGTPNATNNFDDLYNIDITLLRNISDSSLLSSDFNQVILHSMLHITFSPGSSSSRPVPVDSTSYFRNCEGYLLTSPTRLRPFMGWIETYRTSTLDGRFVPIEGLLSCVNDLTLTAKPDMSAPVLNPVTPIEFFDRIFAHPISHFTPNDNLELTNTDVQPYSTRVTLTGNSELTTCSAYREGTDTRFTVSFFSSDSSLFVFRIVSSEAENTFVSPGNCLYRAQFIVKNLRLPHDPSDSTSRISITSKELVVKK